MGHSGEFSAATITAPTLTALQQFADLVVERNRAHNLISRKDIDRLWERHVLDSLRALPGLVHLGAGTVVDIGTGGGFPGVVLAIARPELSFILVERMAKKARFLTFAAHALKLANVTVANSDAAQLEPGIADVVTARAVADPDTLWALALRVLKADGRALLFTGAESADWQAGGDARAVAIEQEVIIEPAGRNAHSANTADGLASGKLSGQIFSVTRSG